jgi:hypothetical protein
MKAKNKQKWISLEIPLSDGFINVKICLDKKGNSVEFCSDADIEVVKGSKDRPWCSGNPHLGYIKMNITDKDVSFDKDHKLITTDKTEKH